MAVNLADIESLYLESFGRLVGALRSVVGDPHVAEECVQGAFARAVAEAETFRGGSLGAWIWRIAVNLAVDVRRRELRLTTSDGSAWDALDGISTPAALDGDPELLAALLELSPRRRLVVFLRYYGELSQREVAEVLGVSEGTVAATLAQARTHLRSTLQAGNLGGIR